MKKKFKFRLESVLKLRSFEEDKAKVALGVIVRKKQKIIDEIDETKKNIDLTYESYEKTQKKVLNCRFLSFFPNYIKSLKDKIKNYETEFDQVENEYQIQLKELARIMGDKKVIEQLKTKKKNEHTKSINKKMEEERDELFSIRRKLMQESI